MKTRSKPLGSKYASSRLGFTIIELLIVMGITAVLATLGGTTYYNAVKKDQLESSAKEIIARLEKAKTKAVNQEQGDYWGVHFEANANSNYSSYAIFKGVVARSDNLSDQKFLGNGVNFLSPDPNGITTMDVVFNKSAGTIKDNADYLISLSDGGSNTVSIYVKKDGLISLGTPAVLQLLGVPAQSSPSDGVVLGMVSTQTLSWASVSGAQKYRLQVANDINFNSLFYDGTIADTSYLVTGLQPYVTYYWRVNAYNPANGSSLWSATRTFATTTTPTAPRSFAIAAGDAQNTLTWLIPTTTGGPAITNYKIHWGTTTGSYPNVISVGNVTNYIHTGLTNGTTYYYKIAAVNALGEGALTSEASATPQALPIPGTPVLATIYNNYIGSPFSISIPFTSQSTITGCQYSIDGGTTWTSANVSGALPNFNCAIQNVTATNGASLSIGMRATNSGGTNASTYTTKTVDSIGPTDTDSWTDTWTTTSPITVTITPTDSGSGVASTKYCVDTANTCVPASGTIGTSTSVTCGAGTVCTQYVRYSSWDNIGNAGNIYSKPVRQDSQLPTNPTLTATGGASQVVLNWTAATDAGSGLNATTPYKLVFTTGATAPTDCSSGTVIYSGTAITYTHTGLTNGTQYSYRVCAIDAALNMSTGTTASATPVTITPGAVTVSPSSATYVAASGTIQTAFNSSVAITSCDYTINNGTNWAAGTVSGTLPNFNCTGSFASLTNGTNYTFNMRATNANGTVAATAITRTADSVLPTATDNWTDVWTATTPLTVTITPADSGSGVGTTKYCVDTANTCNPSLGSVGTSVSVTCTAGTLCTQYVRYAVWDVAGNASAVYSKTVRQDTQIPTGSDSWTDNWVASVGSPVVSGMTMSGLTTNVGWSYTMGAGFIPQVNGQITALGGFFMGTDTVRLNNTSGTLLASATVTSANAWAYTNITPVSVTAGSTYYVGVDLPGSGGAYYSSAAHPQTVNNVQIVNTTYTSPVGNLSSSSTHGTGYVYGMADIKFVAGTGAATITITSTDGSGSGISTTKYCVDTTNTCTPATVGTAVSVTCASGSACTQYLRYATWDVAGNASAIYSKRVRQDNQSPTASDNGSGSWVSSTSSTITITPTDGSGSGISTTKYCVDTTNTCTPTTVGTAATTTCTSGAACTQYVRYATWDVAGNASAVYSRTVLQDTAIPTIPQLTATAGNAQVSLSWTASSDTGSGISYYKIVYATGTSAPANCNSGTVVYSSTGTSTTHTGLTNNTMYYYRICAVDTAGNYSSSTTAAATPSAITVYMNMTISSCSTICSNNGKTCVSIGTDTAGTNTYYNYGKYNATYEEYTCRSNYYSGGTCSTTFSSRAINGCGWSTYCRCS